jgi:hypothetical protein
MAQLAITAVVALAPAWVLAQDAKKPVPPNPVGAGGAWTQSVNKDAAIKGEEFDKKQIELIQKVTGYFNQMTEIKGGFVQTSADNKRLRGKFYVKQPGRFRFDYSPPSRVVILSDGQYMAIQDFDMKTDDRVEPPRPRDRVAQQWGTREGGRAAGDGVRPAPDDRTRGSLSRRAVKPKALAVQAAKIQVQRAGAPIDLKYCGRRLRRSGFPAGDAQG